MWRRWANQSLERRVRVRGRLWGHQDWGKFTKNVFFLGKEAEAKTLCKLE
jgi:hypothetical protein